MNKQSGGCDAIGIEVSVDNDLFSAKERTVNAVDGNFHVMKEKRVRGETAVDIKERLRLFRGSYAAVVQELSHQRGNSGDNQGVIIGEGG